MPTLRVRSPIAVLAAAVLVAAGALLTASPALAGEAAVGIEAGSDPDLVRFDTASPGTLVARVPISGLSAGEQVVGLDVRPATGELWALTSLDRLVKIDVETGQTQQLGIPDGLLEAGSDAGFDFDPGSDTLRVIAAADQIVDVDTSTFVAASGGTVDPAGANVVATAYRADGTLFGIDTSDNNLVQMAGTGELTMVGPLGVDVEGGGFDIVGAANAAFAALDPPSGGSVLYAIDPATGQATPVGPIGGDRLGSFAMLPAGAARTSVPSTEAGEASGAATVTVQRSGDSLAPADLSYRTVDRTAIAGQDYGAVAGTLHFAQGERSKDVSIPLLQDSALEAPESFALVLGPASAGLALDTHEHAIRLLDDERSEIRITVGPDRIRPTFLFAPQLPDHLRALARARRLGLDVACSERCTVKLSLKLGRTQIGAGRAKLNRAGLKRATVRLTKAGGKAVAKAAKARKRGRVALKLSGTATDAAGNVARRSTTLRLARR
jgi:hypothetical protein